MYMWQTLPTTEVCPDGKQRRCGRAPMVAEERVVGVRKHATSLLGRAWCGATTSTVCSAGACRQWHKRTPCFAQFEHAHGILFCVVFAFQKKDCRLEQPQWHRRAHLPLCLVFAGNRRVAALNMCACAASTLRRLERQPFTGCGLVEAQQGVAQSLQDLCTTDPLVGVECGESDETCRQLRRRKACRQRSCAEASSGCCVAYRGSSVVRRVQWQ